MRNLIPLLFLFPACDGGGDTDADADTDTDTDSDTDADTDADTDTDTDTDTTPEHCPTEGNAVVEINITNADPAFTAADQYGMFLFLAPGPPSYYFTLPGDELTSLPTTVYMNNVTPNTYAQMVNCMDVDSDNTTNCEGPGDVYLNNESADLVVQAGMVYSWDVDFGTQTVSTAVESAPARDCP